MKRLRGTPFDPFGYTAERRMERALIGWYEGLLDRCPPALAGAERERWRRILAAPMDIRGYGPVKEEAAATGACRGRRVDRRGGRRAAKARRLTR